MGCGGGEGGGLRTRKTLGGGTTFVWLIHARLGGSLLVTAFQHGLFLAEPLAQHILIIILFLLSHFNLFYSSADQNPRYSNLLRIQLADQRAVMVTFTRFPLVSRLVQRILQAAQRTKEPHQKEIEKRKEREKERKGLQKSALGTLLSLIKFSHLWLRLRQ